MATEDGSDRSDAEDRTPAEPPPLEDPAALQDRGNPWPFWPTIGLGALIALIWLLAQTICAIVFAVVYMAMSGGNLAADELAATLESDGLFLSIATVMSGVTAIGMVWLFAWLRRGYPVREYLGLHVPPMRSVILWTVIVLVSVAVWDTLTYFSGRSIVPEFMLEIDKSAKFRPALWFAVIIVAPLSEESFFRGFLMPGMQRSFLRATGAVVLTAAFWAAIHQQYDLFHITVIFAAGIILGIARIATGSLPLCIYLHVLMNVIATIELEIYKAMQ